LWRVGLVLALLAVTAMTVGCQREQVEDEEPVEAETVEPEAEEAEVAAAEEVEIETAFTEPKENLEKQVTGQAPVTEVVSERGFWVGHKDNKLFTVVAPDVSKDEMVEVNPGSVVDVTATLHTKDDAMNAVKGELDAKTRAALTEQYNVLVVVDKGNVEVVSEPKAGADKKMLKVGGEEYGSFADYDADKNNLLTTRELTRGLEDREYFKEWDKNNDSKLDQKEFTNNMYTVFDADQNDRIEEKEFNVLTNNVDAVEDAEFDDWDDNDNNWLDNEEFAEQFDEADIFDAFDANDNDTVDYNEYGEGLAGVWDKNDDGFLMLDEFGVEEGVEVTLR
jgi:hypothetical protein